MQATFNAVPKWLKEVKEYASPDIKIMLLGNKCDLREQTDSENEGVDYLRAKVNICTCIYASHIHVVFFLLELATINFVWCRYHNEAAICFY